MTVGQRIAGFKVLKGYIYADVAIGEAKTEEVVVRVRLNTAQPDVAEAMAPINALLRAKARGLTIEALTDQELRARQKEIVESLVPFKEKEIKRLQGNARAQLEGEVKKDADRIRRSLDEVAREISYDFDSVERIVRNAVAEECDGQEIVRRLREYRGTLSQHSRQRSLSELTDVINRYTESTKDQES